MSNLGLFKTAEENGIEVVTTKVGDRYVLDEMLRRGGVLGGEQSGHIIFLERNKTGDGLLTALEILSIMKAESKPLSELRKVMPRFPQVLLNVKVKPEDKAVCEDDADVLAVIRDVEQQLYGKGRIFVRPSGTEPCVRVLAEAPTKEQSEKAAKTIADFISEKYSV
jgi:phosphoglucosamine mutase